MKRGDVVTIAAKGDFSGKPRPAVVVQADEYNATHASIVVCGLTTVRIEAPHYRVDVAPSDRNGLAQASQIMADKPLTIRRARAKPTGCTLQTAVMLELDAALRRWLAL